MGGLEVLQAFTYVMVVFIPLFAHLVYVQSQALRKKLSPTRTVTSRQRNIRHIQQNPKILSIINRSPRDVIRNGEIPSVRRGSPRVFKAKSRSTHLILSTWCRTMKSKLKFPYKITARSCVNRHDILRIVKMPLILSLNLQLERQSERSGH